MNKQIRSGELSDGANETIAINQPYNVSVTIEGSADMLLHRWNTEAVKEKGDSAKGSAAKKTDNLESYVYRNDAGYICVPGEYLRMAIVNAAKYRQDPRSPRKSAMDLFKAGVVATTLLASTGLKDWDFVDKRRVVIQRAGITRARPALKAGWKLTFDFMIITPEYIDHTMFRETIEVAGRLVGLGDFRPTYGRFGIIKYGKS